MTLFNWRFVFLLERKLGNTRLRRCKIFCQNKYKKKNWNLRSSKKKKLWIFGQWLMQKKTTLNTMNQADGYVSVGGIQLCRTKKKLVRIARSVSNLNQHLSQLHRYGCKSNVSIWTEMKNINANKTIFSANGKKWFVSRALTKICWEQWRRREEKKTKRNNTHTRARTRMFLFFLFFRSVEATINN